jgi:hypothetical protein
LLLSTLRVAVAVGCATAALPVLLRAAFFGGVAEQCNVQASQRQQAPFTHTARRRKKQPFTPFYQHFLTCEAFKLAARRAPGDLGKTVIFICSSESSIVVILLYKNQNLHAFAFTFEYKRAL